MLKTKQISGLDTTLSGLITKTTLTANSVLVKLGTGDPVPLELAANRTLVRLSTGDIVSTAISDWVVANTLNVASAAAFRTAIGAGTGGGSVTSVSGTAPISVATGTTTPVISISAATTSVAGSMSATDKTKLDSIASGAQVNVPTNIGVGTVTSTVYPLTSSTGTGHSIASATTSLAGVMSAADKTKLDGIATNANNYTHPTGDGNSHIPVTSTTNNGKVLMAGSSANSFSWTQLAPSNSGFTIVTSVGASPADDTTVASEKAVRGALNGLLAANDAMVFKGVAVNAAAMPTTGFSAGDSYKATGAYTFGTSGTPSSNIVVETGDLLICIKDHDGMYNIATNVATYWTSVQTNLDGAVIGPASVTADDNIAIYSGTTGKLLKDSTIKLSELQSSATKQTRNIFTGLEFAASTTERTIGTLGSTPVANGQPIFTINGLSCPMGTVGSLTDDTFGITGTTLKFRASYEIEPSDVFMIVYNSQ